MSHRFLLTPSLEESFSRRAFIPFPLSRGRGRFYKEGLTPLLNTHTSRILVGGVVEWGKVKMAVMSYWLLIQSFEMEGSK